MGKKKRKDGFITLRVFEEDKELLKELANEQGIYTSELLVNIIREYLYKDRE